MSIGGAAQQAFAYAALSFAGMRKFRNREPSAEFLASITPIQFQPRNRQKIVVGYLDCAGDISAEKVLEAFSCHFLDRRPNPIAIVVKLAFLCILLVHAPEHIVERFSIIGGVANG